MLLEKAETASNAMLIIKQQWRNMEVLMKYFGASFQICKKNNNLNILMNSLISKFAFSNNFTKYEQKGQISRLWQTSITLKSGEIWLSI